MLTFALPVADWEFMNSSCDDLWKSVMGNTDWKTASVRRHRARWADGPFAGPVRRSASAPRSGSGSGWWLCSFGKIKTFTEGILLHSENSQCRRRLDCANERRIGRRRSAPRNYFFEDLERTNRTRGRVPRRRHGLRDPQISILSLPCELLRPVSLPAAEQPANSCQRPIAPPCVEQPVDSPCVSRETKRHMMITPLTQ